MTQMTTYKVFPPVHIDAKILLPASKSISNRALIIHALSGGKTMPENLSDCDDTMVILKALHNTSETIDIGAAGTAMRFLTAYLSVSPGTHILTGSDRMKHRPIGVLVDALRYLGAEITYMEEEGYPPLYIQGGHLKGGFLKIPGDVSSQFISALLMVGPVLDRGITLQLEGNIVSRPYIDLTLWTMREFGALAEWTDIDTISVIPQPYSDREYFIENDWSASSYWYEILALHPDDSSRIRLEGLTDGSRQGDSVVRHIFSLLGIETTFGDQTTGHLTTVTLTRHSTTIPRLEYDFTGSPDLAQTLVACCCGMNLPFRFTGLGSLKIKETDRMAALQVELKKQGYLIEDENGDTLCWEGRRCSPSVEPIETYQDHRMAMAFAPLSSIYPGLSINHPEVVSKSYPRYWKDLEDAGFTIKSSGL